MAPPYWVVGGVFTDTSFATLAPGRTLERHGPYADYKAAHDVWAARAWATVDDCNCRFRIVEGSEQAPSPGAMPAAV